MNNFAHSCLITALLSFALAGFVLIRGASRHESRYWSFFCLSVTLWIAGLGMMVTANSLGTALLWLRGVHYVGAILIPIAFFHFVCAFMGVSYPKVLRWGYGLAGVQLLLNFTGLLATAMPLPPFHFYTVPKPAYVVFVFYFFAYVLFGHLLLFQRLKTATGQSKNQILFIAAGTSIGFAGGVTAFFPVFGLPVFPYGVYGVVVYIISVSYAILRHRFMDISIIIRKTLIYSSVTGTLAAVYLVVVATFAHLFEGFAGYQTLFSSAVAAGLVTLFFQPLRKKMQLAVDTKFFRQYVDREEKLYELSRDVVTHTSPEEMAKALHNVLIETFHPKAGSLFLRGRDSTGFVSANAWGDMPQAPIPEDNALARYFMAHPQPFVLDAVSETGSMKNTRGQTNQRRVA